MLKSVLSNRGLGINPRSVCLYEGVIVPTALYGAEIWSMRRKMNVLEIKCLRSMLECREWIELGMKRCVGELE